MPWPNDERSITPAIHASWLNIAESPANSYVPWKIEKSTNKISQRTEGARIRRITPVGWSR